MTTCDFHYYYNISNSPITKIKEPQYSGLFAFNNVANHFLFYNHHPFHIGEIACFYPVEIDTACHVGCIPLHSMKPSAYLTVDKQRNLLPGSVKHRQCL